MLPLRQFSSSFIFSILIHIYILKLTLTQDPVSPTLVTRLIPYLSTDSPYFDPGKSAKDLAQIDLKSSIFRAKYLAANTSNLFHLTDIETQLTPIKSGFLAHLQVGSKFLDQFVYMDTGSSLLWISLLWINCEPCVFTAPDPIFDPLKSSSFEKEKCNTSPGICDAAGAVKVECQGNVSCTYEVKYATHYTKGYLARETFKFGRSREILENIVFGCSRHTNIHTNGVLGLSANGISLIAQRQSSKFSYCIGNISDRSYPYNTLVIGDQIELLGYRTPLIIEGKYYINLEGIKIGDKAMDFDPRIFTINSADYTGGMLVDTGSPYTFIPQVVLEKFEAEVISLIDLLVPRNYSIKWEWHTMLCYNGILSRDLAGFPTVQFQFQGDAIMELPAENMFRQLDENFCLAILPSEVISMPFSILGSVMQQYFYVAYDLEGKKLAFQRMECDAVDDYIHGEL